MNRTTVVCGLVLGSIYGLAQHYGHPRPKHPSFVQDTHALQVLQRAPRMQPISLACLGKDSPSFLKGAKARRAPPPGCEAPN
jgi:hypothetical protein